MGMPFKSCRNFVRTNKYTHKFFAKFLNRGFSVAQDFFAVQTRKFITLLSENQKSARPLEYKMYEQQKEISTVWTLRNHEMA